VNGYFAFYPLGRDGKVAFSDVLGWFSGPACSVYSRSPSISPPAIANLQMELARQLWNLMGDEQMKS